MSRPSAPSETAVGLEPGDIPVLENGDRLTRAEFERRYEALPQLKKAELIEGVVHVPSPVRFRRHSGPHADLISWLVYYRAATPGVDAGDNSSVRLDLDNGLQPDAVLIVEPEYGGQAKISADDYLEEAPELVAEVAASSVSIDLGSKLNVYRRNQVQEYLVWRVLNRAFDWFVLREDHYDRLAPDTAGVLKSVIFPGLWLDTAALIRRDIAVVLSVLQQGLASPEHAAFVARLVQAKAEGSQ